jgi:hypothetical protein
MTLGTIGCGKMGTTLIGGAIRAGIVTPEQIIGCDPLPAACEAFTQATGARTTQSAAELADACEVILLCTMPLQAAAALRDAGHAAAGQPRLVISIAAGITLATLGPVTLFTGQWADLPLEKLARSSRNGLRRLSNSPAGATTSMSSAPLQQEIRQGKVGAARRPRPHLLRDLQPPRRPGRLRPHRRAPQGDPAPDVWGDGDPEGVRKARREK